MRRSLALTSPITSPGIRLVDGVPVGPEDRGGVLGGERPAGRLVGDGHPRSNRPGAHPDEGDVVPVSRVHVGLDLEHESGERSVEGPAGPVDVGPGRRRRGQVDHRVEQVAHAEVGQCRSDEQRAASRRPGTTSGPGRRRPRRAGRTPRWPAPRRPLPAGGLLGGRPAPPATAVAPRPVRVKRTKSPVRRSMTPRKSPGTPTGQVTGVGRNLIMVLDLVEQLQRVAAGPVVLVEEGDDRQVAGPAHLEQLEGLGLDALGHVEHHDRGVGGGQDPVGVLREVAVTRGVEQVDHVVPVGELQHRRGDGDAPLLLHRHPVRGGLAPPGPRLDRPRLGHRPGVEQELLGERGLAGVGVADDGEGSPPGRLFANAGAGRPGQGVLPAGRLDPGAASLVFPAAPISSLRSTIAPLSTPSSINFQIHRATSPAGTSMPFSCRSMNR